MNKEKIFFLIEKYFLTYEEALAISNFFSDHDMPSGDTELAEFIKESLKQQAHEESNQEKAIRYYTLYNKIVNQDKINIFNEEFSEVDEEDEEDFVKPPSEEMVKIANDILAKGITEYKNQVVDFIISKYPDILKNVSSQQIHRGHKEYLESLGVIQYWELPQEFRLWIRDNNSQIETEFNTRLLNYENLNIDENKVKYLDWAISNEISKHNKGTIRSYLKTNNLKLMDITITKLKDKLN